MSLEREHIKWNYHWKQEKLTDSIFGNLINEKIKKLLFQLFDDEWWYHL